MLTIEVYLFCLATTNDKLSNSSLRSNFIFCKPASSSTHYFRSRRDLKLPVHKAMKDVNKTHFNSKLSIYTTVGRKFDRKTLRNKPFQYHS